MNLNNVFKLSAVALLSLTLAGCGQALLNAYGQAQLDSETPESVGEVASKYRGKSCVELALEREEAVRARTSTEYGQKHGRWKLTAVEQVERQKGCLLGISYDEASTLEFIAKNPGSAKDLDSQLKTPTARKALAALLASSQASKSKTPSSSTVRAQSAKPKSSTPAPAKTKEAKSTISEKSSVASQAGAGASPSTRGWLGVQVYENMPEGVANILNVPEGKGLFVQVVASGSAAEKSGMRSVDVILSVDGNEFTKGSEFLAYMSTLPVGHLLKLKIIRAQMPIDQIIQLTEKLPSM